MMLPAATLTKNEDLSLPSLQRTRQVFSTQVWF